MTAQIIATGAEAILIHENSNLIKRRISKSYRIPEIDEKLRKLRTRSETKILEKLKSIISVPKIISSDEKNKEIIMEFIQGEKLSEHLDNFSLDKQEKICKEIGREVGKIHNEDIIHSDLTTSNMILVESNNDNVALIDDECCSDIKNSSNLINKELNFKIFFIDFGLSFHSSRIEDKAVDLHLLRQALESKHFKHWEKLFTSFILGYKSASEEADKVLLQLEKVEKRGRYKH